MFKNIITRLAEALGISEAGITMENHSGLTKIMIDLDMEYNISMVGIMVEVIREFKLNPATITIMYGARIMAHIKVNAEDHSTEEFLDVD